MTEDQKQTIWASFASKRVSQMTTLERKVFDKDFQYGVPARDHHTNTVTKIPARTATTKPSIWLRMVFRRK